MGNLALVLKRQGKLEQAGTLWVQQLEILKRVLGNTHVNTFTTKVNLVFLWYQLGKREETEQLFQEVVQDLPNLNGGEDLQTLKARDLLAHIRFDQGRLEEAESMLGEAVGVAEKVLQLSPLQIAPFQDFQGECLLRLRRFGDAEEVLLKSLAGFESDPERGRADAKVTRDRLIELYSAWGKPEEAARYGAKRAAGR
jgi:tetratricopeptide (TPR) repeat protein